MFNTISNDTGRVTQTIPGPEPDPGPAPEPEDPAAPYRAAKEQRQTSAAIIAEHDNLLADMLFELTMNELEG